MRRRAALSPDAQDQGVPWPRHARGPDLSEFIRFSRACA